MMDSRDLVAHTESHEFAIDMPLIDIQLRFTDMDQIDFFANVELRKKIRERRKNELNREPDSMDELIALNAHDCYMVGNSNTSNTGAVSTMLGNISMAGVPKIRIVTKPK